MKIILRLLVCLLCWIIPTWGQVHHSAASRIMRWPVHHKEELLQDAIVVGALWVDGQTTRSAHKRCPSCVDRTFGNDTSAPRVYGVLLGAEAGSWVVFNRLAHAYGNGTVLPHAMWGAALAIGIDKGIAANSNAQIRRESARARLAR